MPPKRNSKAVAADERKASAKSAKDSAARHAAEAAEAADWEQGAKGKNAKKEAEAQKKAEAARRKAENDRLLAEEEAGLKAKKANPVAKGGKTTPAKKVPVAVVPSFEDGFETSSKSPVDSFSASNIDDMISAMDIATTNVNDKAAMGSKAAQSVDAHPERRFKAAYAAFESANMAQYKKDYPGLRLQQLKDRIYKDFQKSDQNPFNQITVAFDATKEEKLEALKANREAVADRLRS